MGGRYPKAVRGAEVKCIACNAPVASTVESGYVCVECGNAPVKQLKGGGNDGN